MKKIIIISSLLLTLIILSACNSRNRAAARLPYKNTAAKTQIVSLAAKKLPENFSYWYECDYYGNCWDSQDYSWNDCYYDNFAKSCEKGSYWKKSDTATSCCDSWGNCYDKKGEKYADPLYLKTHYCDECGNCYDYYGNFVNYDENSVDKHYCDQYYQYEKVGSWDSCGNSYDATGTFLFYDNYYYDFETCNNDTTTYCGDGYGGPDPSPTPNSGTTGKTDFCDECGNCYDYYGNSTSYNQNYHDEYWCSQYYQYDKVEEWDTCGNAYDKLGNYLFYDNEHYDYKSCHKDYSSSPPSI